MAKRLRELLVGQKLTFDNHHPNVEAKWDKNLHFHKSMTMEDNGKKVKVSGIVYVADKRQVDVQWDAGRNQHKKIKDDKQASRLMENLKEEVCEALKNDDDQTHAFLDNIWGHLKSVNAGIKPEDIRKRFCEAYDNIMDSLGVSKERKIEIRNQDKNKGFFSLYVDGNNQIIDYQGYVKHIVVQYNKRMPAIDIDGIAPIYFICYIDNKLSIGELTPNQVDLFRHKGFRLSGVGIEEAIKGYQDNI